MRAKVHTQYLEKELVHYKQESKSLRKTLITVAGGSSMMDLPDTEEIGEFTIPDHISATTAKTGKATAAGSAGEAKAKLAFDDIAALLI